MVGQRKGGSRQCGDRLHRDLILTAEEAGEQVLVVSDLHLGCGRERETGRYRPRENFFADEEFHSFLKRQAESDAGPGLLVLNGDIIDFVRVMSIPRTDGDFEQWRSDLAALGRVMSIDRLRNSIDDEERRFGLRTDDYKSVWRVQRVIQGHPQFFSSLGWWLEKSGRIVFVKGNHDLELYWFSVQEAIRREIARRPSRVEIDYEKDVLFADQGVQIENLYIEHGHRFDPSTTVYGAATTGNGEEIRLPLGSVVNRYLINKLEEIEPFLNNVKPIERAVRTIALRHPLRCLWQFVRAARFVCRSVRRYWYRNGVGILVYFGALMVRLLSLVVLGVLVLGFLVLAVVMPMVGLPAVMPRLGILENALLFLVIAPTIFRVLLRGASRIVIALPRLKFRKKFPDADDLIGQKLFDHLQKIAFSRDAEVAYGVVGHTHRPDVQVLERGEDRRYIYLNSGTWAPNWRDKRSNLRAGTEFSFLRFDWKTTRRRNLGEYRHRSLVWRDDRNGSVENVIIARK